MSKYTNGIGLCNNIQQNLKLINESKYRDKTQKYLKSNTHLRLRVSLNNAKNQNVSANYNFQYVIEIITKINYQSAKESRF